MILSACLLLISTTADATQWFGPARATFKYTAVGNPYDPVANDAWVTFAGQGEEVKVPAYFDNGTWRANFVSHHSGKFVAVFSVNGKTKLQENILVTQPLGDGYVRRDGSKFRIDTGGSYWPLGHDLGWQSGNGFPDLTAFLATMGQNGINWT